jgi:outer membrane receptor protein involved in Fe transport
MTRFESRAALCAVISASLLTVAQAADETQTASEVSEVVVTGSRVVTNGNDSPTPVTVVSVADTEVVRPTTIAEQLNDMPQFWGSQNQQSGIGAGGANVGGGGANGTGNGNANVLNLRNFGTTRTLVLFDGHRVAPTSANGLVDIDMIPQILLQRVDVVTGGTSAVYGADAVTGVVNFVTDNKFNGLKVNGQVGRTAYSDGDTESIGVGWGSDLFGGRGHILASYEFRGDAGIDNRSSRPFFQQRPGVYQIGTVTAAASGTGRPQTIYGLYLNTTRNTGSYGGTIQPVSGTPANPLNNNYFSSNGVLSPVNFGTVIPGNGGQFSSGGSGLFFDQSLRGKLKMNQLFGRLDYDLTDTLHAWAKVAGTTNYNAGHSIQEPLNDASNGSNVLNLFVSNPYLPATYASQMQAAGDTRFGLSKFLTGSLRQYTESFETQYSIDTGLSGTFGEGYKWELAFISSNNEQRVRANNAVDGRRLAASMDAVRQNPADPNSPIVCYVSTVPQYAALYPGCVADNPFGQTSDSQAALNYFITPLQFTGFTGMQDVESYVSGAPFSSWAGPVNAALSAEWRKLSYRLDSTSIPNDATNPLDCTGLRVLTLANGVSNCGLASQQYFQESSYSQPDRSVNVKEAALELNVPLIKDAFLSKDVSFNGALRYTNYSTSGTVYTWKAGVDWKFNDSLLFRTTRSRDIRAPTMFELYRPTAVSFFQVADTQTGCSLATTHTCTTPDGVSATVGPVPSYRSGNPNLKPELGDTVTAGLVYEPDWAHGLNMAVDAYYIRVTNAIVAEDGSTTQVSAACLNSGGTSPACALVTRPLGCCSTSATNTATAVYVTNVNIAKNWTQGIDLEVNYANRVFERPYSLRLLTSYQPHNVTVDPITNLTQELAGSYASNPVMRASLIANYSLTERFKVSVLERWRQAMNIVPVNSAPAPQLIVVGGGRISPVFYTNLNLGYSFERKNWGQADIYFNVQNLFNRNPPIASNFAAFTQAGSGAPVPGDDQVGRNYTLGFRYRL